MLTIEKILEVIKEIESANSDYHLASILHVSTSTLAMWRKRGSVPYKVLLDYCNDRDYHLDWLLNGSGHMYKVVRENSPEYLIQKNEHLEKECARLRKVVKKIGDDISEINRGAVPDAGVASDTP